MTHVIDRTGQPEKYNVTKLQASIRAACLSVRTPIGEADLTAERVCREIADWLETKAEITANDLRRKAALPLQIYNPEAAYVYAELNNLT